MRVWDWWECENWVLRGILGAESVGLVGDWRK